MSDLEKKIAAVRLRLKLFRVLDWTLWGLLGGLIAVDLLILTLKFFPNDIPIEIVASAILSLAIVGSCVAALFTRYTMFEAALLADARLQLRERLSSALILGQTGAKSDPAYQALEGDARRFALAIQPGRDFRYKSPRHARHTIWPALGIIALYFMPQLNLFGNPPPPAPPPIATTPKMTEEKRRERAEELRQLAKKAREKTDDLQTATDLKLAEKLERLAEDVSLGRKEEKEVVAEMSRLNDELKLRQREINKEAQPFKQLKGLQQANQTKDLQQNLKNMDFQKAADQLQKMAQAMQDPAQLKAEDKKELSQELEQLAQSLKDNPQMAEALQKAAEALKQSAEAQQQQEQQQDQQQAQQQSEQQQGNQEQNQAGQSSQGQQQQPNQQGNASASQSQSAAQQQAAQAAQNALAALQQAAQQMENMEDMKQQMQQLSELQAQMSQSMSQAMGAGEMQSSTPGQQANSSTLSGQTGQGAPGNSPSPMGMPGQGPGGMRNGQGEWSEGDNDQEGMGSGGPGRGRGGNPPDSGAQASGFVDTFVPGMKNEGEIIAVFDIDAPAPKGESNIMPSNARAAYEQRAADAITDTEIPVGMRNSVRDYFERINFGPTKQQQPPPAGNPAEK